MSQRPIHEMEAKWQADWLSKKTYAASNDPKLPKFYGLIEFPFPSGEGLHVGHPRSYTAIDAMTRKQRMEGKNVLFPIGWDAFGLPTENYAIKNKVRPQDASKKNIGNFRRQLQSLGFGFDWDREVDTTDPTYYKWTQWMFQQFFKHGMAYKAASTINWCPRCKIGLANEEAQGGVCERCGNGVEKREKKQWMIRITKYAERLLKDLDGVDYLEKIKAQQTNWIGKSEGAYVDFAITGSKEGADKVTVFTTRPDTLFGVTYLVLAPEHPLVEAWIKEGDVKNADAIRAYQTTAAAKTEMERTTEGKEKTGVALEGVMAVNPANGEQVPVWISDYVLGGYGTGAIMAVPAHDDRDFAFAKQMNLPIKQVVAPVFIDHTNPPREGKKNVARPTVQCLLRDPKTNSFACLAWKNYDWKTFIIGGIDPGESPADAAMREIREETGYKNVRVVQTLGSEVIAKYFAAHKDENRTAIVTGVVLELIDDEREELTAEESAKHEVVWVPEAEVTSFVKGAEILELWKRLKKGADGEMTLEGEAIHSGFLDGLATEEAKAKMIAWLDQEKKGAQTTTYKLRDWVFSRQRYWGEPIPLVHCESCAKTKQKVLLIHGFGDTAEKHWHPWLKAQLEQEGFEVVAPTMSTSDHPDFEAWMKELTPHFEKLGADDFVIGHSLGGWAALHLLARSSKKIGNAVLVAPALGSLRGSWEELAKNYPDWDVDACKTFCEMPLDWAEATANVDAGTIIFSDNDKLIVPQDHATIPAGWLIETWPNAKHITGTEQPALLERILAKKATGWIMDEKLPVELPEIGAYEPTDSGESPLSKAEEWMSATCPRCGGNATRETDTMPNWAGSSWYFLRYADPHNQDAFASPEALKQWMPVDLYNGGMEHTTLHLLYSRFWHKFLWDIGAIPKECGSEPYAKRRSHGLILAEGGEKMSKSKGNVVNPDDVVSKYGADVFRVYEMFMGPFDQPVPWDVNGIEGVRRFLDKVWDLFEKDSIIATPELDTLYHQTVKKLTDGIEQMQFNTCVSALMILMNAYQEAGGLPEAHWHGIVQLLAPFAPHLAEELWEKIGGVGSVNARGAGWPSYDASKLIAATFELVVQVNGKVRDRIQVASDIQEAEAKQKALSSEAVQKILNGATPKQVIYVKGKLVNIVA